MSDMIPTEIAPGRVVVPAPPGWVARYVWLKGGDEVGGPDYLPIIGWALATAEEDNDPVVYEDGRGFGEGHGICLLSQSSAATLSNGFIDAVFYAPDLYQPEAPPVDVQGLHSEVEFKRAELEKRRVEAAS